jgi:4-oxalomesaconate tautomerase
MSMTNRSQVIIPCTCIRAGTTEGFFFLGADLPTDSNRRDRLLIAAVESHEGRGDDIAIAEAIPIKVAVVSRSWRQGIDVEYLYAQVSSHEKPGVDVSLGFGDLLAGVGPFALERGIVTACDGVTRVSIYSVNTGNVVIAYVPTPQGRLNYDAETLANLSHQTTDNRIDFLRTAGAVCGALLPTGRVADTLGVYRATLIDNGTPLVIIPASDLGKSGHELPLELDSDSSFGARAEEVRRAAGQLMKLGDVRLKSIPKMTLISAGERGGCINAFALARQKFQPAIGALEAITLGAACVLPGSIAAGLVTLLDGPIKRLDVKHPTGEFSLELELESIGPEVKVLRSSLICTVQTLSREKIPLPATALE